MTFGSGSTGTGDIVTDFAVLAGRTPINHGIAGQTSTQIAARETVATPAELRMPTVIWAGRNNFSSGATVESDIASMVAALGTSDYLVLSVLNGANEGTGTLAYTQITQINADLAATYGSHYLDVRSYLVSLYDPNQSQDVTDHTNDIPPTSLRFDNIHLVNAGYQDVAAYIYAHRTPLGIN